MKHWKIFFRSTLFAVLLGLGGQAHAQIPTTDLLALAQRVQQIEAGIQQLQQMKAQVQAMSGNLNLSGLLNDSSLRQYLPDQWQSIYSQVQSGQLSGLSGSAQSIAASENLGDAATTGQLRVNNTMATNKAMLQSAYDASIQRLNNIEALMQQSDATQTVAQKLDMQNRMQGVLAEIQNEQTRLQLAAKLQDVEMGLAEHQRETQFKNSLLGIPN